LIATGSKRGERSVHTALQCPSIQYGQAASLHVWVVSRSSRRHFESSRRRPTTSTHSALRYCSPAPHDLEHCQQHHIQRPVNHIQTSTSTGHRSTTQTQTTRHATVPGPRALPAAPHPATRQPRPDQHQHRACTAQLPRPRPHDTLRYQGRTQGGYKSFYIPSDLYFQNCHALYFKGTRQQVRQIPNRVRGCKRPTVQFIT